MRIGVEGVMPMFHDTVAQIVESIESPTLKRVNSQRLPRTTIAFECDDGDADALPPLVKKVIRATDWGKGHVFNVRVLG